MRKDIKLYNMIFPMWSLYFFGLFFPLFWLILLPANFIVDTVVLLLMFYWVRVEEKKPLYWKTIWKSWGFGFLADFVASGILIGISDLVDFSFNVYTVNPAAVLFTTVGVALAGVLIFFFHRKFIWKKIDMEEEQKKKIALGMAVLTAPYLMYLPPM